MPADKITPLASPAKWLKSILQGEARKRSEQGRAEADSVKGDPTNRHARWVVEWIRRRREAIRKDFTELTEQAQHECFAAYRASLVERGQQQLLRRFDVSGWTHKMVLGDFIRFFATATHGESWDKPTDAEILALATEIGDTTV